jgi:hypothetical protein
MTQTTKTFIQLTPFRESHEGISHEKPNSPFTSPFTSSTTHKQPTLKISSKTPFQSKCMHGHLRQHQFCTHSDLNLYIYSLDSENQPSTHQYFSIPQIQVFELKCQKFQILVWGSWGTLGGCSSCF